LELDFLEPFAFACDEWRERRGGEGRGGERVGGDAGWERRGESVLGPAICGPLTFSAACLVRLSPSFSFLSFFFLPDVWSSVERFYYPFVARTHFHGVFIKKH
jgi:hypothetical protein